MFKPTLIQAAASAALLSLAMPAVAQQQAPTLAPVLVQGGRIEQQQFDAAASIYSLDADTIRNGGPQVNLSDALSRVPGVVSLNRNNYAQDVQISIRGFGSRAAFGLRGIRLITDGIPATTPDGQGQASTVSLTSTDRIEVLTGPLAQLYGNAAGGVIQTFTREAGPTPEYQSQIYMGSFGLLRTDWQFSQRTGKVGLVADLSTFSIDGYRDHSAAKRTQFNGVLTVDATPETRFRFIANLFDMPTTQDPLGLTAAGLKNPRAVVPAALTANTRKAVRQEQLGAVMEHAFGPDLKFLGRLYGGNRSNLQYQATVPNGWTGLERRFEGLGLQLNGKTQLSSDQSVRWAVGFDYDHVQEQRQAGLTTGGEKVGVANRNELNQATNRDYFVQANWTLGQRFTLTTGARQSNVTLRSRDDHPATAQDPDGSGRVAYKATSPVLGLTWHVQDNLNLYVNHGRGFETPTLSEVAYKLGSSNTIDSSFNQGLAASRSSHLEVGTKWRASVSSRLDAAWFRITSDDEIVTALSSGGKTAFSNASKTLREGFEVALRNQHGAHWRSLFTATVLNATYQQAFTSVSVRNNLATSTLIPAGNSLPAIPKQQVFASLQWSAKGFSAVGQKPALGTEASIDWIGRSAMWASDTNASADGLAAGYGLVNVRVRQRYQVGAVRLDAFVGLDNLTNKATVGSVIVNQANRQYFEPGLPRNWIAGVQLQMPL